MVRLVIVGVCLLGGVAGIAEVGLAVEPAGLSAAHLLPPTTALYAEIGQPGKVLDWALDHPIHDRLRAREEYQQALRTPQYQGLLLGIKAFEGAVDMRWRPAVKLVTEGGVYFAADLQTKGVAIIVHAGDGQKLASLRDAAFTFARAEATRRGEGDPIKTGEYRGITAHAAGPARLAVIGNWLVVTNQDELGKAVLDRYLDAQARGSVAGPSLATHPQFQEAQKTRPDGAAAWGYADVKSLREAGVAKRFFAGPTDNPLAELLLGGVVAMANQAPYATLALEADARALSLTAAMPFQAAWIGESRAYFFGPDGTGAAPRPVAASQQVFQWTAYRDLAEFWAAAPELFNDNIAAKFAEADGNLTTLFSGRDFGDEVLGALDPGVQVVVVRQKLPQADLPAPDVKLPAFAAVFRLKEGNNVRRNLKVSFQSLIGFLNVVGAMNKQPPLELSNETKGNVEIISGQYLPPADPEDAQRGLINYNFSPTAAFVGERLIVSSTRALAAELAASVAQAEENPPSNPPPEARRVNAQGRLNAGALRAILEDNREQLIAQNILEKGHSREEAEKEVGVLLELLGWVQGATVRLAHDDRMLRLHGRLEFAPPASDAESK